MNSYLYSVAAPRVGLVNRQPPTAKMAEILARYAQASHHTLGVRAAAPIGQHHGQAGNPLGRAVIIVAKQQNSL